MKKLLTSVGISLAFLIFAGNVNLFAQPYYYFLFDNMDNQMGHQVVDGTVSGPVKITNMIDLAYWDFLTARNHWKDYAKRTQLSAATFSTYPVEEMDFAIFPLGHETKLTTNVGGIRVIDAVNKMLDEGKSVILIGHAMFLEAGNAEVRDWFENTAGIDPETIGAYSILQDGTYLNYELMGTGKDDPVFGAVQGYFNGSYGANGVEAQPAMRYYEYLTGYKLKEGKGGIEGALLKGSDDYVEAHYKEFDNGAKLMFWCVDWANASTNSLTHLQYPTGKFIDWVLSELPAPVGKLESKDKEIDFGGLEVGDSVTKTVFLRNNGRTDVNITDMYLWNVRDYPEEPRGFWFEEGQETTFSLKPNETKKVKVKFKPSEEEDYSDAIIFENDGYGNGKLYVDLVGTGGEQTNYGPFLTLESTTINFGSIPHGTSSARPVTLINDGNTRMTIQKIEFLDEEQDDFQYANTYQMPQIAEPGEEYKEMIKFVPLEADKNYETQMNIETNGINDDYVPGAAGHALITLAGESVSESTPAECILDAGSEINFPTTDTTSVHSTINVSNPGDGLLIIQPLYVTSDEGFEKSEEFFRWSPGNSTIEVEGGSDTTITVTFQPFENGEFYCYLHIESNAPGSHGHYEIILYGKGENVVAVKDGIPGVSANIYPNPIKDNSKIELNFSDRNTAPVEIKLIDSRGAKVKEIASGTFGQGLRTFDLNADGLAAGKYFVLVTIGKEQMALPVIIE